MKNKLYLMGLIGTLLFLLFAFPVCAASSEGIHWYIPKNGNKQPILPEEEKLIEKYDGYYLDTSLTDDSDEKILYLTFDAGYENGNVAKILDVLSEENVKATFFILDHMVLSYTDLVKRMKEEGHLVCNHTKNHKNMVALTDAQMEKNLTDLEKIFKEKTGYDLDKYFRFPEGCFDERTLACAQRLGYKTIFWSFGYKDWDNQKQPDINQAKKQILSHTHNGEVVLLHPTSATNVVVLKDVIQEWKQMGYRFGTVDKLTNNVIKHGRKSS